MLLYPLNRVAICLGITLLASSAACETPQPVAKAVAMAEIQTSAGKIVVELYPAKAPKTVDNFIRYANENFYNGVIFHRVINGFMIQGGGFNEKMQEKPTTHSPVPNEAGNGLKNKRGTIAMARTSDPHSANAQFFINVADNNALNYRSPDARGYGYAVFGQVIEGMDVVDKIKTVQTAPYQMHNDVPVVPVVIQSIRIAGEKPVTEDKPAEDKPAEDKPAEGKPAEDKPAEDKPAEDKPAANP